jgi:S1-C subfamily serine protease
MVPRIGSRSGLGLASLISLIAAGAAAVPAIAAPERGGSRLLMQVPGDDDQPRGLLGIYIYEDDTNPGGAKIEKVKDGSPAAKAGLKPGDIVLAFNGAKVDTSAALAKRLAKVHAGDEVKLNVSRDGWAKDVALTAVPRPEEAAPVAQKAWLGLSGEDAGFSVKITGVTAGGPAEKAGLKVGDLIGSAGESHPRSFTLDMLARVLEKSKPGDELTLGIGRDGWTKDVKVKLGAKPGEKPSTESRERPRTEERTEAPKPPAAKAKKPGFLGVYLKDSDGGLAVENALPESPAERGGLKQGDVIVTVDGHPIQNLSAFTEALSGFGAGDTVKLGVRREGWTRTVEVTLGARPERQTGAAPKPEAPAKPAAAPKPAYLGIQVEEEDSDGRKWLKVVDVLAGSPAAKAGIQVGDALSAVDGNDVKTVADLAALLKSRHAGDTIKLTCGDREKSVTLGARED